MARENRLKVISTGTLTANAAGAASFSTSTNTELTGGKSPSNGLLHAVKFVTDPSASAEIYMTETSGTTPALTINVTGTTIVAPSIGALDQAGAAVTNSHVEYPILGHVNVDFTVAGNGSSVSAQLWYK